MPMQWTRDLSTGAGDIDEQHKELFSRFNALLEACDKQKAHKDVCNYCAFLMEYVAYHFAAEEREMSTYKYPGLREHEAEHEKFKRDINVLNRDILATGSRKDIVEKAIWASWEWLVKHVKGTDREMAAFLKQVRGK